MDGLVALDVAIGLSFLFFLLAIIASGLGEWFSRLFTMRAKTLRQGLHALVVGTDKEEDGEALKFLQSIMMQPAIKNLSRSAKEITGSDTGISKFFNKPGGPSAIPSNRFADAFIGAALEDGGDEGKITPLGTTLDMAVANLVGKTGTATDGTAVTFKNEVPAAIKTQIQLLADRARQEVSDADKQVAEFRKRLENWYDESMDRISGWYKRKLQFVLIGIGLVIAISMNVNVFTVASDLWTNDAEREAVIGAAKKADGTIDADKADSIVQSLGLPIGWTTDSSDPRVPDDAIGWIAQLLGWFVTAAAISFGAPFWFDLMGKFIDLRGGGKDSSKEDKDNKQAANKLDITVAAKPV